MEKNIVIIGAGYAGILTAKKLAKRFKKHDDVNITIIDKNPYHTMLTELHEVAANRVDEDSIKISLKKVFAGRKVDVKLDTVSNIEFKQKKVIGQGQVYPYDYLVIAAGSKPTYFGIPGAEEHTFKLWSFDDAVLLREHIHNTFRLASREPNVDLRKRMLTFYVVGAGFTGVEMIGELAEYVPILCEKYEINKNEVTMINVDGLSRPIPNMPEKLSDKVKARLNKMGVKLIMGAFVAEVGENFIDLKQDGKIVRYETGTVIWAAGIQGADITQSAGTDLEMQRGGRIPVDSHLRSEKDKSVFVIGDNMYYIPEGEERPVPQMVENCEQSAAVAANNIAAAVTGKGEMKDYKPKFHGVMVCIGGRYGVAHVGLPGKFFSLPSFLAMFAKHFINIVYFVQVLGWNKIFSYVKHEFFTIRNCRSFVGGHFSNRTPSFLLVPLRIWLGAVWLFEGIMKVSEGWLSSPKLEGFFGGATAWYNSILYGTDGSAAVDAVSHATGASEQVGTVIFNINFLGLFKAIFVSGTELAHSTISDLAFKLDVPLVNTMINKLILPSNGMQLAMQIFIVLAEILLGLALIGGLFTSPAAAFTLVLQIMFVSSTGLYLNTFWMIFAGIAVLIGGGRTLGLDYYVMPALKKAWKRLPFVRKLYIYND